MYSNDSIVDLINSDNIPLNKEAIDIDALLKMIGDARFVLIGEATHGTQEFYALRSQLTKHLITEKNFNGVAIEWDWPDAYLAHRYGSGSKEVARIEQALAGFTRFPAWMWRNEPTREFLQWLRIHNQCPLEAQHKVCFYGLDLYSLYASIGVVIDYLEQVDPQAAQRARNRYSCLDNNLEQDPQNYGYKAALGLTKNCAEEVIKALQDLYNHALDYRTRPDSQAAKQDYFNIYQNAELIKNAELYYRSLFSNELSSWNIRDQHMAQVIENMESSYREEVGYPPKFVIWAHNSHIGDARAAEKSNYGEVTLGQLLEERYSGQVFKLGFTTYSGTVTAADDWGSPGYVKTINPAVPHSYEDLFHQCKAKDFILDMRCLRKHDLITLEPRLHRAIGVVYRPQTERQSHYYYTVLPHQYDGVIHLDQTTSLTPLEPQ
jgi:Erythromycin esterase homolog